MQIILPGWTRVNGQTTGRCRARKLQPGPGSPPGGRSQPGHPPKASAGLLIRSGRARRTVLVHSVRLVVVVVKLPPQGSSHSGPTDRPSLAARLPADQAQPSDAVGTDAGAPMVRRPDLLEWLHDQRTAPGSPGGHDAGQRAATPKMCNFAHFRRGGAWSRHDVLPGRDTVGNALLVSALSTATHGARADYPDCRARPTGCCRELGEDLAPG